MSEIGRVVRALSGRDGGRCFVIVGEENDFVSICDGKTRPLERPKLKRRSHVELLDSRVPEESMKTNRLLRSALHDYNYTQYGQEKAKLLTKGEFN